VFLKARCAFFLVLLLPSFSLLAARPAAAARWVPVGPDGGTVTALAVAPSARRTVYAATSGGLVFRSADAGASWSLTGPGLPYETVSSLLVDRRDASTLYAGLNGSSGKGAFRSVDGGATWTSVGLPFTNVWALAMDPADPDVLLAATGKGVYRSADGGAGWSLTGLVAGQFQDVLAVLFDPRVPGRAWAIQGVSVFVSIDGGLTWTSRSAGLPAPGTGGATALAIDPVSGTLYAGFSVIEPEPSLYRSTDDGGSWTPVAVAASRVTALAVSSGPAPTAYAATPLGLYRSFDGGASWTDPAEVSYGVLSLAVPPSPGSVVYAGVLGAGVFKSTDQGARWHHASHGLNAAEVRGFAIAPSAPSFLYLGDRLRGVLKSTNGGRTWLPTGGGDASQGFAPHLLRVDPRDPRTVYGAADHGRVWKATDGGASWRFLSEDEGMGCMGTADLQIDPAHPGNLYATGLNELSCERPHEEGCLGFRSTDAGESWTCMKGGGYTLALDPERPSTLFQGTFEQIFRSTDAGRSWRDLAAAFLQGTGRFVSTLVAARSPEAVYAATNNGVFQSVDGGATWRSRSTGLPRRPNVYDLAGAPSSPRILYAAVQKYQPVLGRYQGTIYRTADGAATWRPIPAGDDLPRGLLVQMQVHPLHPDALFVAPARGGLYRLTPDGE
jgi:photosystem II stability/assembly factor-like uncharacterized protein